MPNDYLIWHPIGLDEKGEGGNTKQSLKGGTVMVPGEKRSSKSLLHAILTAGVVFLVSLLPASAAEGKGYDEGLRAGKIIDQIVKNAGGEELGEVDDLIMSRNGKIKKAILSVGAYLEIGDRLVAVPFKSLQFSERGGIVYNVTKQQLGNHPVFSYRTEGLPESYYAPYYPHEQPYGPFPPPGRYKGEYDPWEWENYPERLRISAI